MNKRLEELVNPNNFKGIGSSLLMGALFGVVGGMCARYFDNKGESNVLGIAIPVVLTLASIGPLAYIYFSGKGIKNKFMSTVLNVTSYVSLMGGFFAGYFGK